MKKSLFCLLTFACTQLIGMVQPIQSEDQFQALMNQGKVVIDVYATWCGPCKKLAPVLDELSDEMSGVSFVKLDSGALSDLSKKLNVSALPTLIIYQNGKEMGRFTGYKDKEAVKGFINSF